APHADVLRRARRAAAAALADLEPGREPVHAGTRPAARAMTETRLRSAIAVFAFAGLGVASYLTYSRYSGAQLFCATGGCETVQHSRYAVVGGIPVAVLGLVGYVAFLATTVRGRTAVLAGVCVAVVAVLFSTYL